MHEVMSIPGGAGHRHRREAPEQTPGYNQADVPTRFIPHDPSKVVVVEHKKVRRRHKPMFNLVTPFIGKTFCFRDYVKGIKTLPLAEAHAVFYDNSNDAAFRKRLEKLARDHFKSYTIIADTNENFSIEKTEDYAMISWRCHNVYKTIYRDFIEDVPLCLNIEDDVEIPDTSWLKLHRLLEENTAVGTAVGSCSSRRLNDSTACLPILFDITVQENITTGERKAISHRLVKPKPFGTEIVSASHMGLWMTHTHLIDQIGMQWDTDGLLANDICWGYNLSRAGYKVAVDWSVKTKHYFKHNGKKCHV